ncbi:MAG: hypothetical protein HKN33_17665 [Pyrinomonadaceae bacterium]|nr:hypothetical protein [Pyrinomonadaceae bacterium]
MYIFTLILGIFFLANSTPLVESIDRYDPQTGAYLGNEINWYAADGKRLRWEINDKAGNNTLRFFLIYGDEGRETGAVYFEDGATQASREEFTFSEDGLLKTVDYISSKGEKADRTEIILDSNGREIGKRFFKPDGSQYGVEQIFWNTNGTQKGWDFTYIKSKKKFSFRYRYSDTKTDGNWTRRVKSRNGIVEQIEVRTLTKERNEKPFRSSLKFGNGLISTDASETSPSFANDGKSMVFARYGEDWSKKEPFYAVLSDGVWKVEPITSIGKIYNLAISPDGKSVFYSKSEGKKRTLMRVGLEDGKWLAPENLTKKFGVKGSYPNLDLNGNLYFFDASGSKGQGIYKSLAMGEGFGKPEPVFLSENATTFDPYTEKGKSILVTRCFDDTCKSGMTNGIWEISFDSNGKTLERKLKNIPYAWGGQPVKELGLFVYTDGNDILAIPLREAGLSTDQN